MPAAGANAHPRPISEPFPSHACAKRYRQGLDSIARFSPRGGIRDKGKLELCQKPSIDLRRGDLAAQVAKNIQCLCRTRLDQGREATRSNNGFTRSGNYAQDRYYPRADHTQRYVGKLRPAFVVRTEVTSRWSPRRSWSTASCIDHSYNHGQRGDATPGKKVLALQAQEGPVTTSCWRPDNERRGGFRRKAVHGTLDAS